MNAIGREAAAVTLFDAPSKGTRRRVAVPADDVDLPAELVVSAGAAVQGVLVASGRTDFVADALAHVTAPTLFIVGEHDEALRELNQRAFEHLVGRRQMTVISGAGRAFDEPGTIERVGELAAAWFVTHLKPIRETSADAHEPAEVM